MRKTIAIVFAAMLITSVSFATETNITTTSSSDNYELVAPSKVNAFCVAISMGDIDTVKKMIELGTNVNQKSNGLTPLMYAARYNKCDIIKVLVKNGAKLKTVGRDGNTALKIAKISKAKDAIELLESYLAKKS